MHVFASPQHRCVVVSSRDSTKHRRPGNRHAPNEDNFVVSNLQRATTENTNVLVTGVFDGHGGQYVSEFLKETIPGTLAEALLDVTEEQMGSSGSSSQESSSMSASSTSEDDDEEEEEEQQQKDASGPCPKAQRELASKYLPEAIKSTFRCLDEQLYEKTQTAHKSLGADHCCTCKFHNETPCSCADVVHQARVGSTATVLALTDKYVVCGNVGDSDAIVVSLPAVKRSRSPIADPLDRNLLHQGAPARKRTRVQHPTGTVEFSVLSDTHTPLVDEWNEDYCRIRAIARKRRLSGAKQRTTDGIRQGRHPRNNFVCMDGAHGLNMTRAFGNFGLKVFNAETGLEESDSSVISRPSISVTPLTHDDLFILTGSDGVWDNVNHHIVADMLLKVSLAYAKKNKGFLEGLSSLFQDPSSVVLDANTGSLLRLLEDLGRHCNKTLLKTVIMSGKKNDDITLVVVVRKPVLEVLWSQLSEEMQSGDEDCSSSSDSSDSSDSSADSDSDSE